MLMASVGLSLVLAPSLARAEQITQAQKDSGWVSVFDGKTLNGFYVITGHDGKPDSNLNVSGKVFEFRTSDSTIHTGGSPTSHIITQKNYSHYRVRIHEKFDKPGDDQQNAGMLYHTRLEGPRMDAYPRSIEYQGQKRGMGEIWTISNVFVNVTIDPTYSGGHKYKPGGTLAKHGGSDPYRQCLGSSVPYVDNAWNTMEALVRGADSAEHWVNGVSVMKIAKMRWSDANDSNDMSHPLSFGQIALQAEGAGVAYRDYMIMELDSITGKPLHAKPVLGVVLPNLIQKNLLHPALVNTSHGIQIAYPTVISPKESEVHISIHALDGRLISNFP